MKKRTKKSFTFKKETDGNWYVVLEGYPGSKSDLQMVARADEMLQLVANESNEVTLEISKRNFKNASKLYYIKPGTASIGNTDENSGAWYFLETLEGKDFFNAMWLCNVTLYVFESDKFPKSIYIKKI
jgi:hypothetical protein